MPEEQIGILLMYSSHCCATTSLTKLAGVILDALLDSRFLVVLQDFNIHAEAASNRSLWATMGLFQYISGSTHVAGQSLDLVFATGWIGSTPLTCVFGACCESIGEVWAECSYSIWGWGTR